MYVALQPWLRSVIRRLFKNLHRYIGVGLGCTVLNILLTSGLFACGMPLPKAAAWAFIISGQVSFIAHTKWTYHDHVSRRLAVRWVLFTFANGLLGWFLNRLVLAWSLSHLEFLDYNLLVKIASYGLAFLAVWPLNLVWTRFVVFRHAGEDR